MEKWLERTELLIGRDKVMRLQEFRVAVLGLGGVGGAVAEALCRAGVGNLLLIDHDTVDETNLNRQILATRDMIGKQKTSAAKNRLQSIRPDGAYTFETRFYTAEESEFLYEWKPDFVIDAIDTVSAKLHLVQTCAEKNIPLACCLGTGNRLDPGALRIGDISDTANGCGCGLARVMRRELKRRGITKQTVLYSAEPPMKQIVPNSAHGRHSPGSISFVPPVAGFMLAAYAVNYLLL